MMMMPPSAIAGNRVNRECYMQVHERGCTTPTLVRFSVTMDFKLHADSSLTASAGNRTQIFRSRFFISYHQAIRWRNTVENPLLNWHPPKILSLMKLFYGDTRYKVKFKGKFSNSFLVKQGLKQGCPAACLFFNIFFAIAMHVIHFKLEHKGIELRFRMDGNIFDCTCCFFSAKDGLICDIGENKFKSNKFIKWIYKYRWVIHWG